MKKSTITAIVVAALAANVAAASADDSIQNVLIGQRVDIDANTAAIKSNEAAQDVVNTEVSYRVGGLEARSDLTDAEITSIKNSIEFHDDAITSIRKDNVQLGEIIDNQRGLIENASEVAIDASTKVDNITDQVNLNTGAIENLKKDVEAVDANVTIVNDKVDSLTEQVNANTDAIRQNVEDVSNNVADHIQEQTDFNTTVSNELDQTKEQVTEVTTALDKTNEQVNDINHQVGVVAGEVGAVSDKVDSAVEKVESVSTALDKTNDNVDKVASELDKTNTAVDQVANSVQDTNNRVDNVTNALDKTNDQVADLDQQTSAIKQEQVAQADSIKQEVVDRVAGQKEVLQQSVTYTNQAVKTTVAEANTYTDGQVAIERNERIEGDRKTLESSKQYTNSKFAELGKRIDKVRNEANAGTASALAASQIPQVEATGRFSLGAGIGGYNGQSALAVGMSTRINNNTVTKFAVTTDSQHNVGFGAGIAVSW